jgi:glycosyltransferase involved in cell wall biosynthesis
MNYPSSKAASILCVGMGWFPQTPGGLNRYVYELIHQLAAGNDQIEYCGTGLPSLSQPCPIKLTNLSTDNSNLLYRLWQTHHQFCRRSATTPDAINLHFSLYSFPILSRLPRNVPVTFTFHGPWALESQQEGEGHFNIRFKHWLERQVYQRSDRFIVLSRAFGNILHREFGVSWQKIHIIPGGVDVTRFQPNLTRQDARTKLGFPVDRPILFTPRRLIHRMGLQQLLQAIHLIKQQVPDIWLAIAGKGALRPTLEQQVEELGLSNHVQFLGYLPDEQLPIAYQAADLTVVPSQALEGFGLILLESLACGTPVLGTPVGGMPEVLQPFYPHLITESSDADAIARRLLSFFNGELSLPSSQSCRDYVVSHFDWRIISQQVRDVLLTPLS